MMATHARWVPTMLAALWLAAALTVTSAGANPRSPVPGIAWAAALLTQGALFARQAWRRGIAFGRRRGPAAWSGVGLCAYALVGRPIVAWVGCPPPSAAGSLQPTTGPLVIYTIGMLLLARSRVPKTLLVLPLVMALTGPFWMVGPAPERIALALSGLACLWLVGSRSEGPHGRPARRAGASPRRGWSLDLADEP